MTELQSVEGIAERSLLSLPSTPRCERPKCWTQSGEKLNCGRSLFFAETGMVKKPQSWGRVGCYQRRV